MAVDFLSLKHKLEIPEDDVTRDDVLRDFSGAIESEVLDSLGYSLAAETGRQDIFTNLRPGTPFHLSRRPVAQVTAAEGRTAGSPPQWSSLTADLLVPAEGRCILIGSSNLPGWPPSEPSAGWFKWRTAAFPVVRITYDASAFPVPQDLADAILALCAYRWRRQPAGAAQSSSVGGVSESYMDQAYPDWFLGPTARYRRRELVAS